jgi:Zn-dependent alcohol dehydrogenase
MIARTLPVDRINRGFDVMHSGNSIRSVVTV